MITPMSKLDHARRTPATDGTEHSAYRLVFPSPYSALGNILVDLLCGDQVSVETILRRYGQFPGSKRVTLLRQYGWPVQRSEVHFPDPHGHGVRLLTLYSLPPAAIVAAGSNRRAFLEKVRQATIKAQAKVGS
jgi:hypothetical protein